MFLWLTIENDSNNSDSDWWEKSHHFGLENMGTGLQSLWNGHIESNLLHFQTGFITPRKMTYVLPCPHTKVRNVIIILINVRSLLSYEFKCKSAINI